MSATRICPARMLGVLNATFSGRQTLLSITAGGKAADYQATRPADG